MNFKSKSAFSLVETLLALLIVGVVAAITIPQLMQKTQDNEFKNDLRKTFSVISQASIRLASDNGGDLLSVIGNIACISLGKF